MQPTENPNARADTAPSPRSRAARRALARRRDRGRSRCSSASRRTSVARSAFSRPSAACSARSRVGALALTQREARVRASRRADGNNVANLARRDPWLDVDLALHRRRARRQHAGRRHRARSRRKAQHQSVSAKSSCRRSSASCSTTMRRPRSSRRRSWTGATPTALPRPSGAERDEYIKAGMLALPTNAPFREVEDLSQRHGDDAGDLRRSRAVPHACAGRPDQHQHGAGRGAARAARHDRRDAEHDPAAPLAGAAHRQRRRDLSAEQRARPPARPGPGQIACRRTVQSDDVSQSVRRVG